MDGELRIAVDSGGILLVLNTQNHQKPSDDLFIHVHSSALIAPS